MRNEALDIVIVEDNPALLCVLSEIFRESGHHVRAAFHGFVALAEIRKKVPDVLLSDLGMPGMSGYELPLFHSYPPAAGFRRFDGDRDERRPFRWGRSLRGNRRGRFLCEGSE